LATREHRSDLSGSQAARAGRGESAELPLLHQFKNHLAIIVGFCDLLLIELPATDRNHEDIQEIKKAAEAAIALLPQLSKRLS
jgi:hypothetical protein